MRDLEPLVAPKAIAVTGVSGSGKGWGAETVRRLAHFGYSGSLYAVCKSSLDLPATVVPSLNYIPGPVDCLVLALPASVVPSAIEEARELGVCRSAVVYSAGFAEKDDGGRILEDALRTAAGDMPVLGPNCLGVVNRTDRVYASMTQYLARSSLPPSGQVGIVTQSGSLGFVLAHQLERYGIGFSQYVSVGNETCLGAGEVGHYLISRDDVAVLGIYLEAVRHADALATLAQEAHQQGKSVVVLKSGTTDASQRATLSHTAAVAGDPLLFDAFCRRNGIVQANSDESFCDLLVALQRRVRLPVEPRAAIVSMSGGAGALLADRLGASGMSVPELHSDTRQRIVDLELYGLAGHGNPVDLGGQSRESYESFERLIDVLAGSDDIDAIFAYFAFGLDIPDIYQSHASVLARANKPAWMIWAGQPSELPDLPLGVTFASIEQVVRVVQGLVTVSTYEPTASALPTAVENGSQLRGVQTEAVAHLLLRDLGIPYVPTTVLESPEFDSDSLPAADTYVLKVDSLAELHRAKAGLLRLAVPKSDIPRVLKELWHVSSNLPTRRLLIQPMLGPGPEVSIGVVRDDQYGVVLIASRGGSRVEDRSLARSALACPATESAMTAFCQQVARLIPGAEPTRVAEIARLVEAFALGQPLLRSMDINPLIVGPGGSLVAVDSLIICEEE